MISFSGGKDSTALLLMLLEKGVDPGSIVFFDTGWEFPDMLRHIDAVENHIKKPITRLHPKRPFDYWMFEHRGNGYGFPQFTIRWCTREKINAIQKFWRSVGKPVHFIGIAYDEIHRIKTSQPEGKVYPLIDWEVTEQDALEYCYAKGFDWNGLYTHFKRASCWCCPLQSLPDLRNLRSFYPKLWRRLLKMQSNVWNTFRVNESVFELERRFAKESSNE